MSLRAREENPFSFVRDMECSKHFNVVTKPLVVTDEQMKILCKIGELLDLLERQRDYWKYTNGIQTLGAIANVEATLLAISSALKSPDFVLERFAAALWNKSLKDFLKAVRCPLTDKPEVQKTFRNDKLALRNGV